MRCLQLVFLYLFLPGWLFASSNGDTTQLREVQVMDFAKKTPFFRVEQQLDSLVTKSYTNLSLAQLLSEHTFVAIKNYGAGSSATISIRGTNASHSRLFWNGISLNSPMLGLFDFSIFPVDATSSVAVLYGGQSPEFGTGAIGGIIKIDDKLQFKSTIKLNYSQQFGSFGLEGNSFSVGIGNKRFQSKTSFNRATSVNNYRYKDYQQFSSPTVELQNAGTLQQGIYQSFAFKINEKRILKLNSWFQYNDRNIAPTLGLRNNVSVQTDRSFRNSLQYEEKINDKLELNVVLGYINDFLLYKSRLKVGDSIAVILSSQSISEVYSFRGNLTYQLSDETSLKFLGEANNERASVYEYRGNKSRNRYSLAGIAGREFGKKAFISASVRKEFNEKASPITGSLNTNFTVFGKNGIDISTSVSTNYALPTLNDLYWRPGGNPDLKAEESTNFDLKLNKSLTIGKVKFYSSFSTYYTIVKNWILWQPSAIYNGNWSPQNLRRVRTSGFESSNEIKLLSKNNSFSFRVNYALTNAINTKSISQSDASNGKQLIYVPKNTGLAQFIYGYKSFQLRYGVNYYGYRFTTSDNSSFLPSYLLNQIVVQKSIRINKYQISADAGVYNLFYKSYQNLPDRIQPGRNFLIHLNLTYN